jgi:predicted LPLAT superfamily acyltransferase
MASEPADTPLAARADAAKWVRTPERGSARLVAFGVFLALRIGRPLAHLLLHSVSIYFFLFAPAARRCSRDYLRRVLGREVTGGDSYRQIHAFATTILDRLYLLEERHDYFEISNEGEELMLETVGSGQGAFLLGSHLGSFALVSSLGRRRPGLKVAMAMYDQQAGPVTNLFNASRAVHAPEIIALGHLNAMLRIRDGLDEGKFIGMLADRSIADAPMQIVPFLDAPALFPSGPMRVAAALRRPVFFMTGLYRGGNRYHVVFRQIADFSQVPREEREAAVREAIVRYAQLLEQYCRSDPYNWFNFYDFWHGAELPKESAHQGHA